MIDGQNSVNCIRIVNSSVFFIIRNCRVYNSISTSLTLYNVNNSKIYSNDCLNNGYAGILLENCQNNTISSNVLQDNSMHGIKIDNSQENNIFKNKMKNNEYGVWIVFSDNNKISINKITFFFNSFKNFLFIIYDFANMYRIIITATISIIRTIIPKNSNLPKHILNLIIFPIQ